MSKGILTKSFEGFVRYSDFELDPHVSPVGFFLIVRKHADPTPRLEVSGPSVIRPIPRTIPWIWVIGRRRAHGSTGHIPHSGHQCFNIKGGWSRDSGHATRRLPRLLTLWMVFQLATPGAVAPGEAVNSAERWILHWKPGGFTPALRCTGQTCLGDGGS